jgi:excisionase family DNA binding protein
VSGQLAQALLGALDDRALDELAERLVPRLAAQLADAGDAASRDGWVDTKAAAAHLGISTHAVHRLTAERRLPFHQDSPGCKCWFKRSELDAWRGRFGS